MRGKNGRAIIFDLFGTIVAELSNEYKKGLEWLRGEVLREDCEADEVLQLADWFRRTHMGNRTATHKEASHIQQIELFRDKIGFRKEMPLHEVEFGFFSASRKTEPKAGAIDLLAWLKEQGYSLFVMSNTIFSAVTIKRHLETLGMAEYFDGVFTSGDCGYRKPGQRFFSSVFAEIKKCVVVKKNEVVFIGNSLEKDMLGAKKFGFMPVWLSDDTQGFGEYLADCERVDSLIDCKRYFESEYIRIANFPKTYSVADGIGNRLVVYTQGCEKHCPHCHNQETWDFSGGKIYSIKELVTQILSHISSVARNVTISGGEPLAQPKPLLTLLNALRQAEVNACLYTGLDFDEVPSEIKEHLHYLKTGAYVHELRTTEKGFYGSTNQEFWAKREDGTWHKKI
jgi:anaerobic ribonucleoside-triphosphate reductase activating protein